MYKVYLIPNVGYFGGGGGGFANINTSVINNFVVKCLHTSISQDKVLEVDLLDQNVCTVLRILILNG